MYKIPLFKVLMSPHLGQEIQETLFSGYIGQGEKVEEFESLLSNTFDIKNVLTVNSGTSAIKLALRLVKEQDGDEVLMSPLDCFATTSAVLENNLRPKWVDVNTATFSMSLQDLERKLSSKTKIIVLVHFGGMPVDLDKLEEILDVHEDEYGFRPWVIEDCAHALGSKYKEKCIGSHGNICCFSFQATKLLTTGDGGAIVLPNEELYERAKLLRWYGLNRDKKVKYQNIQESGFKCHMNDINATIGIENLKYILEEGYLDRDPLYSKSVDGFKSSNWLHPIITDFNKEFDSLAQEKGIQTSPAHYRCDRHECVKNSFTYLPNMDWLDNTMTCIPSGWWVSQEDANYIKDVLNVRT